MAALRARRAHHVGEGDVKDGVSLEEKGGDLDRHSRVLGAREGEDIYVHCGCL